MTDIIDHIDTSTDAGGPRRAGRRGRVIRVLAIVIVAVVAVLAVAGVLLARTVKDATRARDTVSAFFGDLQSGKYEDAYGLLCAGNRRQYTAEQFAQQTAAHRPAGHDLTGELRVNRTVKGTTGTVGVRVTFTDGSSEARLVPLAKDGSHWRICGSPY
ncbi:hypothetical protein KGA66_23160 [Actinocrinis puniceicyclus]|uniref:DUF4878 domain-containing protein n=1 Tax=Actinocrinis puniceicyclus TaxID=977794 RepID=A0A8J8BGN8_9ACTN|nr:DUF4878 domain-containing protein [Actinocrinis puniceicyclus]MBS2965964.1 hypothetical protein [Actinocrinis puniceicyclus]